MSSTVLPRGALQTVSDGGGQSAGVVGPRGTPLLGGELRAVGAVVTWTGKPVLEIRNEIRHKFDNLD